MDGLMFHPLIWHAVFPPFCCYGSSSYPARRKIPDVKTLVWHHTLDLPDSVWNEKVAPSYWWINSGPWGSGQRPVYRGFTIQTKKCIVLGPYRHWWYVRDILWSRIFNTERYVWYDPPWSVQYVQYWNQDLKTKSIKIAHSVCNKIQVVNSNITGTDLSRYFFHTSNYWYQ